MSEITPAQVASALTGGDDVNEVLNRWVDVNAIPGSSTVRITLTPINDDGDPDTENAQHFRAVVVEDETEPIVLDRERYRNAVEEVVKAFSTALASSALEMYPYHLARLKGALWDLAEAAHEGEDPPIVLERPVELGLSWDDGGDLLVMDAGGVLIVPRGCDQYWMDAAEARDWAAQLAAMADALDAAEAAQAEQERAQ